MVLRNNCHNYGKTATLSVIVILCAVSGQGLSHAGRHGADKRDDVIAIAQLQMNHHHHHQDSLPQLRFQRSPLGGGGNDPSAAATANVCNGLCNCTKEKEIFLNVVCDFTQNIVSKWMFWIFCAPVAWVGGVRATQYDRKFIASHRRDVIINRKWYVRSPSSWLKSISLHGWAVVPVTRISHNLISSPTCNLIIKFSREAEKMSYQSTREDPSVHASCFAGIPLSTLR